MDRCRARNVWRMEAKTMQNPKNMPDAMDELAKSLAIFFHSLLENDIPVDVAANLSGKLIESMILGAGKIGGD